MQPSIDNLNTPSSRVLKDSMPLQCWIIRCINFGICESSTNLFLLKVKLYFNIFEAWWILNEHVFCCFITLFNWKQVLTQKKKQSAWWILTQLDFCCLILTQWFCWKVNRDENLRVGLRRHWHLHYYFLDVDLNFDHKKKIRFMDLHTTLFLVWWIFIQLFWKRCELMVNLDPKTLIKRTEVKTWGGWVEDAHWWLRKWQSLCMASCKLHFP